MWTMFRFLKGRQCFYGVGTHEACRTGCERAFASLSWSANWDKSNERLICYPGGLIERASAAYRRGRTYQPTTKTATDTNFTHFPPTKKISVQITSVTHFLYS